MKAPEPIVVAWRGRRLRVRHDDPHLGPYTPRGATLRAAVELASDVEGLRLVLDSALGDRYRVKVADDGSMVGLWRLSRRLLDRTMRPSAPNERTTERRRIPAGNGGHTLE